MEYAVLIERKKEGWHAFIPALADLSAEGGSRDEAVQNVQRAAQAYLGDFWQRFYLLDSLPLDGGGRGWGCKGGAGHG